jgi:hypothetical protein
MRNRVGWLGPYFKSMKLLIHRQSFSILPVFRRMLAAKDRLFLTMTSVLPLQTARKIGGKKKLCNHARWS